MGLTWESVREKVAGWLAPSLPRKLNAVESDLSIVEESRERMEKRSEARDLQLSTANQRIEKQTELLRKSVQFADRLDMRLSQERESRSAVMDRHLDIIAELDEAAALAGNSPWGAPERRAKEAQHPGAAGLMRAKEAILKAAERESQPLRETIYGMAELEIALDDRGWKRLVAQSQYEFSRMGIQSIILISRLYYIKNPLARRGVDVSAFYVFGRGIKISSPNEAANEILAEFFDDPRNASTLSHTALVKGEKQTYTDGNNFWAYFSEAQTGRLTERAIDPIEVSDIICDPEDGQTEWFYRRDWSEERFEPESGRRAYKQRSAWYFALGYEDIPNFPANVRTIETFSVMVDSQGQPIPILHHKDGELPGWKFGCPRMYPAIDWLRAYRQVLEDLCTLWRALSRFAWNVETEGGAPAIAAFKQTLATTLANDLTQIETNPPPVTGSAFITGPGNKLTPFQSGGATTMNPDNARRVLLMVCAAFGIGEHLMGDATTGSLATAASLERPTELMFLERQEVWREILQRKARYALSRSLRAPKGKLREAVARAQGKPASEVEPSSVLFEATRKEGRRLGIVSRGGAGQGNPIKADLTEAGPINPQKITVEVSFPDILAHEIKDRVAAITQALTLDGKQPIGIDMRTGIGLLLSELGVEDVPAVLEAMFPANEYEMDRTIEPPLPNLIRGDEPVPAADDAVPGGDPIPASESVSRDPVVIERAVAQILRAAQKQLANLRRSA